MKKLRGWLVFSVILLQALIPAKVKAATIFVDGMSFEITRDSLIKFIESKDHYEAPYLHSSDLGGSIKSIDPKQNFVAWSGNAMSPEDVKQAIAKLKDEIMAFHNTSPHEPINIVSHSYGTVIAYKALEEISIEHPDIKINTFITMGSPLGKDSVGQIPVAREVLDIPANKSLEKPENVKYWLNYYADHDGFGGPINKKGVVEDIKMQGDHDVYFTNPNYAIEIAFVVDALNKFSKDGDTIKNTAINSSQQIIITTSTQQAIKLIQLPKTLPAGLHYLPYGQISPELAKKPTLDSSRYSERTAQQLLTPVRVNYSQTFDGTFTQIPDYLGATTADISVGITNGTRTGTNSRPGDFTGSYTARGISEPGWVPVEHHNTPFTGVTASGTVEVIGFKEGPLKGSMTVNWESALESFALSSNKVTIGTNGSVTADSLNGSVTNKALGVKEGSWTGGTLNQTPK